MIAKPHPATLAPLERSDRTTGRDELNLAEFPLAAIAHRVAPEQRTLVFEDDIFDEGTQQPVHRKLIISASEHSGLPTPLDSDVLLVLIHLTNARNGFTERTVAFSRYELVKFMGWDEGGKSYRRLDEALTRWASVTLYYNRAWWDKTGRGWRSRTFHVLEALDLRGREGRGPRDESLSTFTWNEVLFQSFSANNIKRLNLDVYFKLERPAARQAYRFLDKRFYRAARLEFDLRTFACEHVGLSRNYDSAQLKRRLQPALEELEAIGFLQPASAAERYTKRSRGEWRIHLNRGAPSCAASSATEIADTDIVAQLVDRGIRRGIATDLAGRFPSHHIHSQIQQHDHRIAQGGVPLRNPAGYLVEAIRGFKPTATAKHSGIKANSSRKSSRSPSRTALPDQQTANDAELAAFRQQWEQMTAARQQAVLHAALEGANPFQAETLRRLERSNSPLVEEVRMSLARAYLNKHGTNSDV